MTTATSWSSTISGRSAISSRNICLARATGCRPRMTAPSMRRVMAQSPVDLVILDLMLPGEDGLTLARSLRRNSQCRHHHPDRARRDRRPHHRARDGGRRLSAQALPPSRTAGAGQKRAAPRFEPQRRAAGSRAASQGAIRRLEPRSFEPRAVLASGRGGPADHRRIRFAGGVRQQRQPGADPRPAAGPRPQPRGRAVSTERSTSRSDGCGASSRTTRSARR